HPLPQTLSEATPPAASRIPEERAEARRFRDAWLSPCLQYNAARRTRHHPRRFATPPPPRCTSPLVPCIADPRTDGEGFHPLAGERHKQGMQGVGGRARIEPGAFGGRVEDHGHPVMDRLHQLIAAGEFLAPLFPPLPG